MIHASLRCVFVKRTHIRENHGESRRPSGLYRPSCRISPTGGTGAGVSETLVNGWTRTLLMDRIRI